MNRILIFQTPDRNYFFFDISSVGWILFPQLAEFHFLSWPNFVSSVGRFSFPQLAGLILINRLRLPESRRRYPFHLLDELGEMSLG